MPKLKALRAQTGVYGRVSKHGIVDVDENTAKKLLKGGNFEMATKEDIAAAQKAFSAQVKRAGGKDRLGFAAIAEPPQKALTAEEKAEAEAKAAADAEAAEAEAAAAKKAGSK